MQVASEVVHSQLARFEIRPIRIVPKGMYPHCAPKIWIFWQPFAWPEVAALVLFSPCLIRAAMQAVYEYQVDKRFRRAVDAVKAMRTDTFLKFE